MSNALEYLLIYRIKDELNINCPNYKLWESLFPLSVAGVTAKESKATNLGKDGFPQLLATFAKEFSSKKDKEDLVAVARSMRANARQTKSHRSESMQLVYDAAYGLSSDQGSDPLVSRARAQLIDAVRTSVTRGWITLSEDEGTPSVLGRAIRAHAEDCIVAVGYDALWSDVEATPVTAGKDFYGLGFLFSDDFKDEFGSRLRQDFAWKMAEEHHYSRFHDECERLQALYLSDLLDEDLHLKVMTSLVAMYVLASLIGPASFAGDLGWDLSAVPTSTGSELLSMLKTRRTVSWRLQPVVLTGQSATDYYTDPAPAVEFGESDVLHVGRPDPSTSWLDQAKPVPLTSTLVSRTHAKLSMTSGGWTLHDMGSVNGTLILRFGNGGRVFRSRSFDDQDRSIHINAGDIIFFGPKSGNAATTDDSLVRADLYERGQAFRFERIVR